MLTDRVLVTLNTCFNGISRMSANPFSGSHTEIRHMLSIRNRIKSCCHRQTILPGLPVFCFCLHSCFLLLLLALIWLIYLIIQIIVCCRCSNLFIWIIRLYAGHAIIIQVPITACD